MRINVKCLLLAVFLVGALNVTAYAEPLMRYTYLDLNYRWLEIDPSGYGGSSSNDVTAALSISPVEHFALEGGYGYGNLDFGANRNTFSYGVVGYLSLTDSLDLYAHGGGLYTELDTGFFEEEGEGVYAGLGVRGLLSKSVEGAAEVQFTDSLQQQWLSIASVVFAVHENIGVKGQVTVNDNGDAGMLIGVRVTP